jgi:inorganic pyrophosphatase
MNLDKTKVGQNPPDDVNVIIEIPQGGLPVKYEMDKLSGPCLLTLSSTPPCFLTG